MLRNVNLKIYVVIYFKIVKYNNVNKYIQKFCPVMTLNNKSFALNKPTHTVKLNNIMNTTILTFNKMIEENIILDDCQKLFDSSIINAYHHRSLITPVLFDVSEP